jgi:hypothetical protein
MSSLSGNGIFPLPAIGPHDRPISHSRRLHQQYRNAEVATDLANHSISALNQLSTSFSQQDRRQD